jgi:hypothetical protein
MSIFRSRRLSPSLVVAALALMAAGGGTALAAGEIITSPSQIAPRVIDSRHIRPHGVTRVELQRPALHVRVSREAELLGDHNDGTVRKLFTGRYEVKFNTDAVDSPTDPKGRPFSLDDCSVVATPRFGGVSTFYEHGATLHVLQNDATVTISSTAPVVSNGNITYLSTDVAFDVAAIC